MLYGQHIKYQEKKGQPGKVANPARGQLNRENGDIPVPCRDRGYGLYYGELID